MKKLFSLFLLTLACFSFLFAVGCEDDDNGTEPPHICEFSTDWEYDETNHYRVCSCNEKTDIDPHEYGEGTIVFEDNDYVYRQNCKVCNSTKDGYVNVIYSANDCFILQNSINYIAPTVDEIGEISITSGYSNITIIADNVIAEKITIGAGCSNITIVGVDFSYTSANFECGGVYFAGSANSITLQDCNFSGGVNISGSKTHLINKLTINNCTFTNIANDGNNGVLTAIYLSNVQDFTVYGCSFDTTQYSAINVGNEGGCVEGTLTIINSTFKNTTSRPLRFSGTSKGLITVISGNTFNALICSDNQYIKSDIKDSNDGLIKIVFGINNFETAPTTDNFNGNIEINLSQQVVR